VESATPGGAPAYKDWNLSNKIAHGRALSLFRCGYMQCKRRGQGRNQKKGEAGRAAVQQSVKVEFVIRLKPAKELALAFPLPLLGRADEVIE
jgi:hypothetical protein